MLDFVKKKVARWVKCVKFLAEAVKKYMSPGHSGEPAGYPWPSCFLWREAVGASAGSGGGAGGGAAGDGAR